MNDQPKTPEPEQPKRPYAAPLIEPLGHMSDRTQGCGGTRPIDGGLARPPRRASQPIFGAP